MRKIRFIGIQKGDIRDKDILLTNFFVYHSRGTERKFLLWWIPEKRFIRRSQKDILAICRYYFPKMSEAYLGNFLLDNARIVQCGNTMMYSWK